MVTIIKFIANCRALDNKSAQSDKWVSSAACTSSLTALIVLAVLLTGQSAQAATQYLSNSVAATNTWSTITAVWVTNANGTGTAANWTNANQAFIEGTAASTLLIGATVPTWSSIIFSNSASTLLRSSSATTQSISSGVGGFTVASGAGSVTIGNASSNLALTLTASQGWTNNSSSLFSVVANVTNGGYNLTLAGSGSTTIGGVLSGSGTLINAGTGTNTLANANTYSGGTVLNAGTLAISNNAALGTGAVSFASNSTIQALGNLNVINAYSIATNVTGTFDVGAFTLTNSGIISGSGGITFTGVGTLTLSGVNTYSGNTILNGGTLQLNNVSADGTGTVSFASNATVLYIASQLETNAYSIATNVTANLGVASGLNVTNAGIIDGAGALIKTNTGNLVLSGVNTFSGGVTVGQGTITLGNVAALGSISNDVTNNGTLNLNGYSITNDILFGAGVITNSSSTNSILTIGAANGTGTYTGTIAGSGIALVMSGTGFQELTGSNSYSNTTKITSGTLDFYTTNSLYGGKSNSWTASNIIVQSNATIAVGVTNFGSSNTLAVLKNLTNSSSTNGLEAGAIFGFDTSGTNFVVTSSLSNSAAGALGYAQVGSGTLTLSASNSYTGGTTINGGLLVAGNNFALGSTNSALNITNGTFNLNGFNVTLDRLNGSSLAVITNSAVGVSTLTVGVNNSSSTFAGDMDQGSGSITFVKNGTGTFTFVDLAATPTNVQLVTTTIVNGGVLALGDGVLFGTGAVTNPYNFSGSIAGSLTINSGATVQAGSAWGLGLASNAVVSQINVNGGTLSFGETNNTLGGTVARQITLNGGTINAYGAAATSPTAAFDWYTGGAIDQTTNNGYGSAISLGLTNNPILASASNSIASTVTTGINLRLGSVTNALIISNALGSTANGVDLLISGSLQTGANGVNDAFGSIVKTGPGVTKLSGSNSYNGTTTISNGLIAIGNNSALSTNQVNLSGGGLLTLSNESYSLANTLNLASNSTITNASGSSLTLSGTVTNTGSLTKVGAGTLVLTGSNSYSGGTTISAGAMNAQNSAALGSAAVTVNTNSTLQLQGDITLTNSVFYSGSGTNNNGAIENISGSNTLSGTLKANTASSRINSDSGTLTITTFDNSSFGPLVVGGAGNVILQNGMFNNSNLQKDGTGTLTINSGFGGNQSGLLSISNGAVALNAGVNLTANNGITVFNGGTLQLFGGFNGGVGNNSSPALTLYGSGNNASGALESTSGTNTWNSAINLSNSATITADDGSALNLTSSIGITGATYGLTLNGAGNIFISSGISTTTGSLTKNGTGTATLSGSNSYSGGTKISNGVINVQNSYALGTGTVTVTNASGSALQLQGGITVSNTLLLGGSGISNNGALESVSGTNTYSGAITGTGTAPYIGVDSGILTLSGAITNTTFQLHKEGAGTLVFNTAYNPTGVITIDSGTLKLGAVGSIAADAMVINSGATFDLNGRNATLGAIGNQSVTLNGGTITTGVGTVTLGSAAGFTLTTQSNPLSSSISGNVSLGGFTSTFNINNGLAGPDLLISANVSNGGMTVAGGGELTLSGSNNFSGGVTLNAGTLNINNSYALGTGTFTIASNSTIDNTSAGSLTLSNSGSIQWLSTNSTFIGTQSLNLGSNAINFTTNSTITVVSNALTLGNLTNSTGIAITKAGAGTLVLAGTNNMGYGWIVSAGALNLQNANAIGSKAKSSVTVSNGAALQLQGGLTYVSASGANASTTINGNGINTNGAIENVSGNNTYSSDIILGSAARINSDAGLLTLNSSTGIAGPGLGLTLGGAGNITVSSVIATTTGSLTKDGTGTVTLTAANTYSGGTILNAGTLAISNSAALGTGTLNFASNGTTLQALANLSITNPLTNSANGTINNGGFAFTNTGVISGGGGTLTFAGTGTTTISATNTYTGVTAITGGVTSLGNAGKLASTSAIVTNGATLLLSGAANGGLATGTSLSLNGNVSLNSTSGTRPSGVNAGNLTLTGTSSINFGATATGNTEFSFYTLTQNGNYLDIFNWKGSSSTPLFNNAGSTSYTTYSNILFYSGDTTASAFLGAGQSFAGSKEIVPVPEPAVFLTALLLLGILTYIHRALITRYLATFLGLCYSVFFVWK